MKRSLRLVSVGVLLLALTIPPTRIVQAAEIIIRPTVFSDDAVDNGNCTLREAVLAASAKHNRDGCQVADWGYRDDLVVIELQAGTYEMSLPGMLEEEGLTGDFDLHGWMIEIRGAGRDATIIDANRLDRIFELHSGYTTLRALTLTRGETGGNGDCYLTDGGAIYNHGSSLILHQVKLIDNWVMVDACSTGGAIFNDSTLEVYDSWFEDNHAETGSAAIDHQFMGKNKTFLTIKRTMFTGNHGYGSTVSLKEHTTALIEDSQFIDNWTVDDSNAAIGMYDGAIMEVRRCHFRGGSSDAGILGIGGLALIEDSIFEEGGSNGVRMGSGNAIIRGSSFDETGIHLSNGYLSLINSTIEASSRYWWYLVSVDGGTLKIQNATLVTVGEYTVLGISGGEVEIHSSILASEGPACEVAGGLLRSLGHNLVRVGGSCTQFQAASDQVGTAAHPLDPRLGPLADNGGPTDTMALLPGSPAINRGEQVNCPPTDQRGVERPQGPVCDIGAYEVEEDQQPPATATRTARPTATQTARPVTQTPITPEPTEGQQPGEVRLYLPVVSH